MNQPDPLDRLRRQIQAASQQVRLAPGSEVATIRAAHRRRTRTRALVGGAAAVAVGTGTVVAVQQLGKTGTEGFAVGTGDGTAPDNAVAPVTDPASAAPVATTAPSGSEPGGGFDVPTQPALVADSAYTWNATTVDAANSVAGYWLGRVPGVIISTAPGRAADPNAAPVQQAYYSADGVTFELLDVALPDDLNAGGRLFADGDSIYQVGTAAGIAETSANPVLVEVSEDQGASWTTVELPVDTHELRQLPFVASSFDAQIVPSDAGPVLVVRRWVGFDPRDVPGLSGDGPWSTTDEGVALADPDCLASQRPTPATVSVATAAPDVRSSSAPEATPTVAPADEVVRGTTPPATALPGSPQDCFTDVRTWAELGVPDESLPYVSGGASTSRLFRIVDGQAVEIALPEGASYVDPYGQSGFQACSGDGSSCEMYDLTADATWQVSDVPMPVRWGGGYSGASATHRFATAGTPDGMVSLLAASAGGEWTYTDVRSVLPEFSLWEPVGNVVTEDGFVQVAQLPTDLIAEQGGVSLEAGGLSVARASYDGPLAVTTATGEAVEVTENWVGNGDQVQLVGTDGEVLATLTQAEYETLYAYDETPGWAIVTTADGVNVAVESAGELAGVADDEIAGLRVNAVGRQLIVTVVLRSESSPGIQEQIILVGTPND